MKIGIIGAGFTGLTSAYQLLHQGHEVILFEKASQPGGLAIGYQEKEWDWTLEAFYHHWFTNDKAILGLAKQLEYPVVIKRPKTSSYINNAIYQLDSPLTLLTFSKLNVLERIRMAAVLGGLRYNPFWKPLEKITAASFLPKTMGKKAYTMLWEPLLVNKFGTYTKDISLAWFWARIVKRTTSLAYPEGGFLKFAQALAKAVTDAGGEINYNTGVDNIHTDTTGQVHIGTQGVFDKVIVTLPSFQFVKLAPDLPEDYRTQLLTLKGIGAVVLVMRLTEPFFKDHTYWLNICDTNAPVLAIVEHTNFMDRSHYHNEHLVYLGNYLPSTHRYFSMTAEEIMKEFDPYLQKIHPGYTTQMIGVKKFAVPFAQPIIPTDYSKKIPPFQTPLKNVYLANMQQVYPWERGSNYAVALGEEIAKLVSKD